MATLIGRSRSLISLAKDVANARRTGDAPFSWEWDVRRDLYGRWQAFYENNIYEKQIDGGYRELILRDLFGVTCADDEIIPADTIGPYFNPIKPIVDAYQNVFMGAFGREIKVAQQYNGNDVNAVIIEPKDNPLGKIWRWSNLDTEKQAMQRHAAGLGAVGIRVVPMATNDARDSRVTIQFDHPGMIKDYDTNSRGDVVGVLLEYTRLAGPMGKGRYDVKVEELMDKDTFRVTYNGKVVQETPNVFGFCPYVILKHGVRGEWGAPAFFGSETPIHLINRLRAYIAKGVPDVVDATWFATAGGPRPASFTLGRKSVAYVQTAPDSPNPTLEPLVAPLNIAEASAYATELEDRVKQRQPEMLISDVKLLSGISGETLAKVLKPAEAKILEARAAYEHAMIRALQMALSEMIVMGLFDAGTGTGNAQAADNAYQTGLLNFEFESRAALPMTPYDKQISATAEQADRQAGATTAKLLDGLVDKETQLKEAGFSQQEIADIQARMRTQDSVPTEGL